MGYAIAACSKLFLGREPWIDQHPGLCAVILGRLAVISLGGRIGSRSGLLVSCGMGASDGRMVGWYASVVRFWCSGGAPSEVWQHVRRTLIIMSFYESGEQRTIHLR